MLKSLFEPSKSQRLSVSVLCQPFVQGWVPSALSLSLSLLLFLSVFSVFLPSSLPSRCASVLGCSEGALAHWLPETARWLCTGFLCGVIPGGAEEAITGHENAYNLKWGKRTGFARVVLNTGCPIVPLFVQNVEEMRFNPIFWVANKLRVGKLFDWVVASQVPFVSWLVKQIGLCVWFNLSLLGIPVPARVTLHVGTPLYPRKGDTPELLAARAHDALQSLINKHQPGGVNYWRAVKSRFFS